MAKNKKEEELSPLKSLIPGAVGGALSTTVTAPLDRIKDTMTQLSTSAIKARAAGDIEKAKALEASGKNLWTTAKYLAKGGPKTFYKGLTGSLIKMPIAMGLTFAAGDYVKKQLQKTSMKKSEKTDKAKKVLLGLGVGTAGLLIGRAGGYRKGLREGTETATQLERMLKGKHYLFPQTAAERMYNKVKSYPSAHVTGSHLS